MNMGIAFSGGGFRATLFHLGVVRYLRDEGKLADVTHICSVSGGSVLAAHLVQNWERYTGSQEDFAESAREVIGFVQSDVRGRILRRFVTFWPTLFIPEGSRLGHLRVSATRLLEGYYHRELFEKKVLDHSGQYDPARSREGTLEELDSDLASKPYCQILTTNLNYGTVAAFTAKGYNFEPRSGEPVEYSSPTTPIALAVAASSAYPALFAPVRLTKESLKETSGALPDQVHLLTDGGVYDNLGVRQFRSILANQGSFPLVRVQDVTDPARISQLLFVGSPPEKPMPFARMWGLLTPKSRQELEKTVGNGTGVSPGLVASLNFLIRRRDLYDPHDWEGVTLTAAARTLVEKQDAPLDRDALFLRNRLLLESAFPGAISGCEGQGIQVLVSDAGRSFDRIAEIKFSDFILSTAVRASDVLMNRITEMERRESRDDGHFLFLSLNDTVDNLADPSAPDQAIQRSVAQIRTDFDSFSDVEVSGLVRHGYCVARQAFAPLLDRPSICLHEAPWDPVRSRPPGYDYSQTDPDDRKQLERSKYRRVGLASTRDWISYVHLVLLAALALAGWLLWSWVASVVSELILIAHTGSVYSQYKAPALDSWNIVDPYYFDAQRYKEADLVPEPDFGGFTIESDDRLFDLQNWRVSGPETISFKENDEKFSAWVAQWRSKTPEERDRLLRSSAEPMFLTRQVRFSKKAANELDRGARNDEIHLQFLTHGFGVLPRVDPDDQKHQKWSVVRSNHLGSAGSQDTKKWDIVVQLPDEKPGESITLRVQALFWNGYQSPEDLRAMIKLNAPTQEASLWVLFPEEKPYDTYVLQQYVVSKHAAAPIAKAKPLTNAKRTKLFWPLDGPPDPNQIYEIRWSW